VSHNCMCMSLLLRYKRGQKGKDSDFMFDGTKLNSAVVLGTSVLCWQNNTRAYKIIYESHQLRKRNLFLLQMWMH